MNRIKFPGVLIIILFLNCGCDPEPEVVNQMPTAKIIASPTSGQSPLTVLFDGSLSSDPEDEYLSYSWVFGDGSSSSNITTSKMFTESGTYNVTLTVMDEGGLEDSDQISISVSEPPPPPDLFPIVEGAQWVYFVKATETENGNVSDYDEGYMYLLLEEINPDYQNIDVFDLRITGKRFYNKSSLVTGEYLHMMHRSGDYIKLYHNPGDSYNTLLDMKSSSWSNYAMLFAPSSSQSVTRTGVSLTIGLGTYFTQKINHQRDNWGENYVNERYDISEAEYLNPDIGLIYRKTSRYVNFLDCFTCPVYGGGIEVELVGYYIPQPGGDPLVAGVGYNPDNPYGGDLGLLTIWANQNIGFTEVFIDNEYVGTISNYWSERISCDQPGALNVTYPDGTYTLTAESSKGYYWEGIVTFLQGSCDDVELLLSKKGVGVSNGIPMVDIR